MRKIVIAYVPVLHEGYRRFFEKYKDAEVFIFNQEIIEKFDYLYKEIRALKPELVLESLRAWGFVEKVAILDTEKIQELQKEELEIFAPNEDVVKSFLDEHFSNKKISWDDVFLRWDKHNYESKVQISPDLKISSSKFDKKMMSLAFEEADKGSDWWRRVGAVIVKDKKVAIAQYNRHVPSAHTPYANGDPRNTAHKGVNLELSTSLHAEAGAIAQAAKQGISLAGAEIFVTTFPCPPCAKLIAYSGIKRIYYGSGYGVLDGESILKSQGVEIVFVQLDIKQKKGLGDKKYRK